MYTDNAVIYTDQRMNQIRTEQTFGGMMSNTIGGFSTDTYHLVACVGGGTCRNISVARLGTHPSI